MDTTTTDAPKRIDINTRLLTMDVGEEIMVIKDTYALRVPGGWVFTTYAANEFKDDGPVAVASCFVPMPSA